MSLSMLNFDASILIGVILIKIDNKKINRLLF